MVLYVVAHPKCLDLNSIWDNRILQKVQVQLIHAFQLYPAVHPVFFYKLHDNTERSHVMKYDNSYEDRLQIMLKRVKVKSSPLKLDFFFLYLQI